MDSHLLTQMHISVDQLICEHSLSAVIVTAFVRLYLTHAHSLTSPSTVCISPPLRHCFASNQLHLTLIREENSHSLLIATHEIHDKHYFICRTIKPIVDFKAGIYRESAMYTVNMAIESNLAHVARIRGIKREIESETKT